MSIHFYNTMSRTLEEFEPQRPGQVRMYNCGPTVYSSPHIGNFRAFIFADLLRRFLEWRGLRVEQVMNITDVGHLRDDEHEAGEDKMELASRRERKTAWQIAEHYTEEFFSATRFLHFQAAHHYPRATDHIADMVEMVKALVERDFAYVAASGNVYFDVGRFEGYGRLSGNRAEDLLAGARVEVNPEKRDPRDFALWKIDPQHQMQWDSPWGRGFPGWHIECSAMSRKYLGDTLDIHTGGEDNIFPHHECEIAQSECSTGQPFVRYWLHVRHLLVDGRKMSKSLGNFHTLEDLRGRGHTGDGIRLALMRAHYRESLNFTFGGLDEAERKVERYREVRRALRQEEGSGEPHAGVVRRCAGTRQAFGSALDQDLNLSVALAALDELVTEANRVAPRGADAGAYRETLEDLWQVLGLVADDGKMEEPDLDTELADLIQQRQEARARKDFQRADAIRQELRERGVELIDTRDGVRWKRVRT